MRPRTLLFWTHLVIGVATLLFIFIMSATGVLLTYQRQILEWYDTHDYRAALPSAETPHLRPGQIAAAVRAERPDATISSITFHADPSVPVEVGIGRRSLFLNPYSGHVLGGKHGWPATFLSRDLGLAHRAGLRTRQHRAHDPRATLDGLS